MKLSLFCAAAAVALVSVATTAVVAQQDPIAARKALMKESGQATAVVVKMTKGETPFDLAAAQKSLKTYQDIAAKMPALFPESSKSGGETTAAPAIWEKMDDFKARFVKFGEDAKAAEASVKDLDSLKAAVANVTRNCGGCHEAYRVKKS
ncbi:c-type cytochrome [Undibacter mobilis]|uniref:Cytochrome c n=1 Tax=Undibacter mobilis TaxID=2292256 RepID=A0A371BCP4_9BRAD|nr:cytochrome c [Undibacter mobilis]RDV05121.1 cytochrome c [Undibacter mobilis]